MSYMDNPPLSHRPRTGLERRSPDWQPDPNLVTVSEVVAETPGRDVDEVLAEARRRGADVTRDFVRSVMEA